MKRLYLIFSTIALLTAFSLGSCSKDDNGSQPDPIVKPSGAPLMVMIVFAPGQLGDGGYADKVFEGIHLLRAFADKSGSDTLDVDFISTYNRQATREALQAWAEKPQNPFNGEDYKKRLLVLTEPYMIDWLDDIKDTLQQTDHVLMLKTSEKLIDEAAVRTGLGDRLHCINISAANSIRKYCHYADSLIVWMEESDGWEINHDVMPIFRLYSDNEVDYQDSIYIALQEEFGDETQYEITPLSSHAGEGLYAADGTSVSTMAYNMADNMATYALDFGYFFSIIDIGSASTGWNYYHYALIKVDNRTLHFDGSSKTLCDYYVSRLFDFALMNWVLSWMKDANSMPKMLWHGDWDLYCIDNLPEVVKKTTE